MDCWLLLDHSLGSVDSILNEMTGCLDSVAIDSVDSVHGGGVNER
jgi:hypothetical protein